MMLNLLYSSFIHRNTKESNKNYQNYPIRSYSLKS